MNTASFLVNRSPSTTIESKTLFEVWSRSPVDYFQLRAFGCSAYNYVGDGKLEQRAKKCIFLGYAYGVKGYRLRCSDPKSLKLIISRNVTFNEFASLNSQKGKTIAESNHGVREQAELEVQSNDLGNEV